MKLDDHGQPPRYINAKRVADRSTDELIGLCKGVLADGIVSQEEAEFLQLWLRQNEAAKTQWPGNILYTRVYEYLEDGVLDRDEKDELFELLLTMAGASEPLLDFNKSTSLPVSYPMPTLNIIDETFCFTGRMTYGSRKECQMAVRSLGGDICTTPLQSGCVLVIGYLGSRDWIHSTHGRKIEQAVRYRDNGFPITIVTEDHWTQEMCRIYDL
ncbi:hypothetical protein [uncultured Pseudodesulfovibrio sp.]|uniref:hypothetical protein n=1 Tax=uncultured Pseudodesulfovibrio sp. TaxID=2035858 RepID=UPI0029C8CB8C|nr:hypothetical protein [uncultured Pseudodesulfovibrio sp.]